MLTEAKNQIKISMLSIKYAVMREMLNKATFISNIVFMILNNASFIIQWVILFSLKDNVGNYTLKQVLLLWGFAATTFVFSHFFFKRAYSLSEIINTGKLDSFLVQPKNVLLSVITASVEPSALGDMLYGFIMLFIFGINLPRLLLFILFTITGGLLITSVAVILGSLSFWFQRSDAIAERGNNLMTNFATYPDGIFKGVAKILLYTLIPVGFSVYIPIKVITEFNLYLTTLVILVTSLLLIFAYIIFYKGLKRYSSSNLMIARL